MSQSKAARDRIRTFVQRIERIDEELACMNADKSEVYKEAKGEGYDLAALRLVISERRKRAKNPDLYRETRSLFDLYMDAVEGSSGTDRATRVHDRLPPTQAMGVAADPDPNVTIINETPAPTTPPGVDGGQPQPSVPASLPEAAASTSDPGPVGQGVTEGAQPADQTQSPSLSAPEEADCSVAGELIRPSGVSADETEGDGLAGGGDGAAVATFSDPDDDLSIPRFLRRDANNRAPWMEGTG